jgi:hypothetical protein
LNIKLKSNNTNNGLPLFVHTSQDLYRRSCRPGSSAARSPPKEPITVESAKKYKSHKKRVYFNLIKSNNANNGLPLFVHFLQDLYRRSCRTGVSCSRACPGSASPFFVLCFLLVKFINLLDMDGLSVVTLTALSTVMPKNPALSLCFAFY